MLAQSNAKMIVIGEGSGTFLCQMFSMIDRSRSVRFRSHQLRAPQRLKMAKIVTLVLIYRWGSLIAHSDGYAEYVKKIYAEENFEVALK